MATTEMMVIDKDELQTMRSDGGSLIESAKAVARSIVDGTTLNRAATMMLEAKTRIKVIKDRFKDPKSDAKKAHQSICDLESELVEPYERIEREILKPAMARFEEEQQKKRRDEEERLNAEAKKKEEDARLKHAEELSKNGQSDLADQVLDEPVVVAPVVLPRIETPAGISYRDVWKYRITNEHLVPRQYLSVDDKKISGIVRALKNEAKIPGVEVYCEKSVAGRS